MINTRRIQLILAASLLVLACSDDETSSSLEPPPTFVTSWGPENTDDGTWNCPLDITTEDSVSTYVMEMCMNRIYKFSQGGQFIAQWGQGGPPGPGTMTQPTGIAVDKSGIVYAADPEGGYIQKFTADGQPISGIGRLERSDLSSPAALAIGPQGNLLVLDAGRHSVLEYDSDWNLVRKWGSQGSGDGQLGDTDPDHDPPGIAVDSNGNVYVADVGNSRIQKFSSDGVFLMTWGGPGDELGNFSRPRGIAVGLFGNIYVADTGNDRIQKFDSFGKLLTAWGSSGTRSGQFSAPSGISIGSTGLIFVIETENPRVQKFAPN